MAELARCPHCGAPVRPARGPAQDERRCPRCAGRWRVEEGGRLVAEPLAPADVLAVPGAEVARRLRGG